MNNLINENHVYQKFITFLDCISEYIIKRKRESDHDYFIKLMKCKKELCERYLEEFCYDDFYIYSTDEENENENII